MKLCRGVRMIKPLNLSNYSLSTNYLKYLLTLSIPLLLISWTGKTDNNPEGLVVSICDEENSFSNVALALPDLYIWTGAEDSLWTNPNNWDGTMVPDGTQNVLIPDTDRDPLAFGIQVNISSGDTMTVEVGASLYIDGDSLGSFIDGITNQGVLNNYGTIDIKNTTDDAIETSGITINYENGLFRANNCDYGLWVVSGGELFNYGRIVVGNEVPMEFFGVQLSATGTSIFNDVCGFIDCNSDYIADWADSITNNGTIVINSSSPSDVEFNNGKIYNLGAGGCTVGTGNAPITSLPATYNWTGSTDSEWLRSCNWDEGLIPDGNQNVVIPDVSNAPVAAATALSIGSGDSLIIEQNASLYINGQKDIGNVIDCDGSMIIEGRLGIDSAFLNGIVLTTGASMNVGSKGEIQLNCMSDGISNQGGYIENWGQIIGENITSSGIYQNLDGSFYNMGGQINLNTVGFGMFQESGYFANDKGEIIISSANQYSILNRDSLVNKPCSYIEVDSIHDNIFVGQFINQGIIVENGSTNSRVYYNEGTIYNLNGGTFTVDSGFPPITVLPNSFTWNGSLNSDWNNVCNWNEGLAPTGSGNILIQAGAYNPTMLDQQLTIQSGDTLEVESGAVLTINSQGNAQYCLRNLGVVKNLSGGTITVDGSIADGIKNDIAGRFYNDGDLLIGDITGTIGNAGIWNVGLNVEFYNAGYIQIDHTGFVQPGNGRGIANFDGNFENSGGLIVINNVTADAIWNFTGTSVFTNFGIINLGLSDTIHGNGILIDALFINNNEINIYGPGYNGVFISNTGALNNYGDIAISNTGHSNLTMVGINSQFINSIGGAVRLDNANHNNIYCEGVLINELSGSIHASTPMQHTLFLQYNGVALNDSCSSIVGDSIIRVDPTSIIVNDGYIGANGTNISGTFDNTNGFVYDQSMLFDCNVYGGTCMNFFMQHDQFTGDLNMNGTSYCEGDTTDFECSSSSLHYVSNTYDDGPGSLRWAVNCAVSGDTILFSTIINGELIQPTSGQIDLAKDLVFIGNGKDLTIIDGSLDSNRFFIIYNNAEITFFDMTMQYGGHDSFPDLGGCLEVFNFATVKAVNCKFVGNQSKSAGGVFFMNGSSSISFANCLFEDNHSNLAAIGWSQGNSSSYLTQCLAYSNSASPGLLIALAGNKIEIYQSTITNNNCGIHAIENHGIFIMSNSILTGNGQNELLNLGGGISTVSSSLVGPGDAPIGVNGNITGDPMFIDTANADFNFLPNSPCINAGSNLLIPIDSCNIDGDTSITEQLDIDFDGGARVENDTVEMGAFEGYYFDAVFRVDMNKQLPVDAGGVFVAGDFQREAGYPSDWIPDTTEMLDPDGDNIYEATVTIFSGDVGRLFEYKFLNGPNGWENVPIECGFLTTDFINRGFYAPQDTKIVLPVVCFNECSPCNDMCEMAQELSCTDTIFSSTITANPEANLSCPVLSLDIGPGVWYRLLGNGGVITVSTFGSGTDFDTQLGVFRGNCSSVECFTRNDDYFSLQSKVSFGSELDSVYYIYVTGFSTDVGNFQLNVSCGDPCPDDLVLDDLLSLAGKYSAKNSITVEPFTLIAGLPPRINSFSSILLNAPNIDIKPLFEMELGGVLETDNTGCP